MRHQNRRGRGYGIIEIIEYTLRCGKTDYSPLLSFVRCSFHNAICLPRPQDVHNARQERRGVALDGDFGRGPEIHPVRTLDAAGRAGVRAGLRVDGLREGQVAPRQRIAHAKYVKNARDEKQPLIVQVKNYFRHDQCRGYPTNRELPLHRLPRRLASGKVKHSLGVR